ncbi:hypothetical protein NUACC21_14120 [Scytonema sp. NUACC21]
MKTVFIKLPKTVLSALRKTPDEFIKEMRLAAAIKWYELGEISQSKAAEIAGVTRLRWHVEVSIKIRSWHGVIH